MAGIGDRRLIGGFLIVRFAWLSWPKIDHCARHLIDQQAVLIGMRLLLAAVMLLLALDISGPLPSALSTINRPHWRAF